MSLSVGPNCCEPVGAPASFTTIAGGGVGSADGSVVTTGGVAGIAGSLAPLVLPSIAAVTSGFAAVAALVGSTGCSRSCSPRPKPPPGDGMAGVSVPAAVGFVTPPIDGMVLGSAAAGAGSTAGIETVTGTGSPPVVGVVAAASAITASSAPGVCDSVGGFGGMNNISRLCFYSLYAKYSTREKPSLQVRAMVKRYDALSRMISGR